MIDERIKLPISQHWHDGQEFHVRTEDNRIVVEPRGKQAVAEAPVELAMG